MDSTPNLRLRLLSYVVIAYMLMAFGWWSVLLYTKNQDAFQAKRELLRIGMVAEGIPVDAANFENHPRYKALKAQYLRQEEMIFGEVIVFTIILLIGMYLINRGYLREMRAAQQRRNFLLSITHELKSPIAAIRLVLETLLRRSNLRTEQREKLLQNSLGDTERLHRLVNDLLLSARLETAYEPQFESLNLQELIREQVDYMQDKHPKASIRFECSDDLPLFNGDVNGITSIILNLLENAVKYSPAPDLAAIQVQLKRETHQVVLCVADQGLGIPKKEKKRIFDKFYRVGNENVRRTKGTGLGLYIVHQIVLAHDGKITVQDNKPAGTVFTIKFPMQESKKANLVPQPLEV